jgi:hypothetical protein
LTGFGEFGWKLVLFRSPGFSLRVTYNVALRASFWVIVHSPRSVGEPVCVGKCQVERFR